jgi:3-dehydroquinate dehydratase / shikimate dehydrogenase
MTFLAVPVFGSTIEQIRTARDAAARAGADLVELRIDLMEGVSDDDIRSLRDEQGCPLILTIRSAAEGGRWDRPDDERISRLIELGPIADYVDVELATWQRSANIRQKVGLALKRAGHVSQADGREEIYLSAKRKLILSRHDFQGRPPKLQGDFLAMLTEQASSVVKLAWRARTVRDNFEAFELMRTSPRPAIIICMGADGLLSRVLAGKFGAFATFASVAEEGETAAGQLSIARMKQLYRWDSIDVRTAVYGVIGDPVQHSLSPAVHNAAFAALGCNALYLPMRVDASYESFKAFMVEVLARPWLDFRGFSVTVPHKENALRFLRENGGQVDALAERLGAVNTIRISAESPRPHEPLLSGCNTDYPAALEAVRTGLNCQPPQLAGRTIALLGAGGVARAVVAALTDVAAKVTIFNRTETKARALADLFGCDCKPWDDRLRTDAALIVNCTSVGMWPDVETSPLPAGVLHPGIAVFDTVYNPHPTRLLRDAAAAGCVTIDGLTMFVEQARRQFQLWTGLQPQAELLRLTAETALSASSR